MKFSRNTAGQPSLSSSKNMFRKLGLASASLFLLIVLGAWSFLDKPSPADLQALQTSPSIKEIQTASTSNALVRSETASAQGALTAIALAQLPPEGQAVYAKILRPHSVFRYEKDGSVFNNFEGKLPKKQRGYYREYTVATPKLTHRGARRIVCGGKVKHQPDACFYTDDHYDSFKVIVTGTMPPS